MAELTLLNPSPPSDVLTLEVQPLEDLSAESWRYQPEVIKAYYDRRPLEVIKRFINILIPLGSFFLGIWWDRLWGKVVKEDQKRAVQLREMLTKLGPAYIKIGQALSTRPDLVPPLYLKELTTLQVNSPPFLMKLPSVL